MGNRKNRKSRQAATCSIYLGSKVALHQAYGRGVGNRKSKCRHADYVASCIYVLHQAIGDRNGQIEKSESRQARRCASYLVLRAALRLAISKIGEIVKSKCRQSAYVVSCIGWPPVIRRHKWTYRKTQKRSSGSVLRLIFRRACRFTPCLREMKNKTSKCRHAAYVSPSIQGARQALDDANEQLKNPKKVEAQRLFPYT